MTNPKPADLANHTASQLLNLTLESGHYKSIKLPLEWLGIPRFTVLTGENGTGKTQLLEAIDGSLRPQEGAANPFASLRFVVAPDTYTAADVLHVPNMAGRLSATTSGLTEIRQHLQGVLERLRKPKARHQYEAPLLNAIRNVPQDKLTPSFLLERFSSELFYRNPSVIHSAATHYFMNYEIDLANLLRRGKTQKEAIESLGPPPWTVMNELLSESGFHYELMSPADSDLREPYRLMFRHRLLDVQLDIGSLSSGETTLVQLFFWLFVANQKFRFPKLILLDEPDSHLHPSLIEAFIRSLKVGLVERLGSRVIMTTHRPETIAFAPPDSVFEMHQGEPRIRPSRNKHATVALLTNNLVALVTQRRPV